MRGLPLPALCCSRQYAAAQRVGAKWPFQVHLDDRVPLLLGHVDEHPVAQDAGVVDEDVEVAEGLDRAVDQPLRALPVGDVVAVDDCLATERLDLLDDVLRRCEIGTRAVVGAAEVVDDETGTFAGEQQRVLAPDARGLHR